jgi:uncharacterized protein (TIGR00725 family)
MTLVLDRSSGQLARSGGFAFDPASRTWTRSALEPAGPPTDLWDAVKWLQTESGVPLRIPVAVIGPREARSDQLEMAEALGSALAEIGLTVICGGRQGVMEAVCRGVDAAGGISVGLLPDETAENANAYVTIPIATGIGVARNAVIARAAFCMVAVGGGYGTISEAAFGLQFEKPVFSLLGGPDIVGVSCCGTLDEAVDGVCRVVLGLSPAGA